MQSRQNIKHVPEKTLIFTHFCIAIIAIRCIGASTIAERKKLTYIFPPISANTHEKV